MRQSLQAEFRFVSYSLSGLFLTDTCSQPSDVGDVFTPSHTSRNGPPSPKSGRLSYRARHDPNGSAIGNADLGNGCVPYVVLQQQCTTHLLGSCLKTSRETLRPVKRLDAAGSLRLSEGFVGAGSGKAGSAHSGGSGGSGGALSVDTAENSLTPQKSRSGGRLRKDKEKPSPTAAAGRAMVGEVVLPTLDKVSRRASPTLSSA